MIQVSYGPVQAEIERWQWPTEEIFRSWKREFLRQDDIPYFDVYLVGGFLEQLKNTKESTPDVDIILTGCDDVDKTRALIESGTRIGIQKHQVFFDILWFDSLPAYADDPSLSHTITTRLISNQWSIDGEVKKRYPKATEISPGLWEMKKTYPTRKQRERIDAGHVYPRPHLISAKSRI